MRMFDSGIIPCWDFAEDIAHGTMIKTDGALRKGPRPKGIPAHTRLPQKKDDPAGKVGQGKMPCLEGRNIRCM